MEEGEGLGGVCKYREPFLCWEGLRWCESRNRKDRKQGFKVRSSQHRSQPNHACIDRDRVGFRSEVDDARATCHQTRRVLDTTIMAYTTTRNENENGSLTLFGGALYVA